LRDRIRFGEAGARSEGSARFTADLFSAAAGTAGDGRELHLDEAEIVPVQPLGVKLLKQGTVRLIKDHAQTDHAGPEAVVSQRRCRHVSVPPSSAGRGPGSRSAV